MCWVSPRLALVGGTRRSCTTTVGSTQATGRMVKLTNLVQAQTKPMQRFPELPIAVIACKIFQGLIDRYLPEEIDGRVTFLDYGLHRVPKKLKEAVQEASMV